MSLTSSIDPSTKLITTTNPSTDFIIRLMLDRDGYRTSGRKDNFYNVMFPEGSESKIDEIILENGMPTVGVFEDGKHYQYVSGGQWQMLTYLEAVSYIQYKYAVDAFRECKFVEEKHKGCLA